MKIPYRLRYCKARWLAWCLAITIFCGAGPATAGDSRPVILALGDSLTAGFGVHEEESYPSRLQKILRAEGHPHRVVNAGVSGDTTAGGVRRIRWLMQHRPQIVILALGANDGLRGLALEEMYANLETIILLCRENKVRVLLAGMKIPPNYGVQYSRGFEAVYSRLADEYGVSFLPFLLEGVAGDRKFTQPDGIHPLAAGYAVVVRTVWDYLQPMLSEDARPAKLGD